MPMLDAYVCGNCPGASDSNPGTQQSPVATIGRGILNAVASNLPTVFIATSFGGVAHTYSEDVTLAQGRSLQGRWAVTSSAGGLAWARTAGRSTLQNTQAIGLKAPIGLTSATVVEGLLVRQAATGGSRVVGVSVNSASPLLRDVAVSGPTTPGGAPTESIGIDVQAGFAGPAVLRLESTNTARNAISPQGATGTSTGLRVSNGSAQVTFTDFVGGAAGTDSQGARLLDGASSTFQDSTFSGGLALSCFGFLSQGSANGVLLERVTATGCPRAASATFTARTGYGVAFESCGGASPGGASPIVRNASVSGGAVGGTNSHAIGGAALDGCSVRFESTGSSTSNYSGASGSPIGSVLTPEAGTAIVCSFRDLQGAAGQDSRCAVSGSALFGSAVGTARSIGLHCEGSCATQGASCNGSCGEVVGNTISGQTGNPMSHLVVTHGAPQVRQNRIGFGGNGTYCNVGTTVRGVEAVGAGGAFVNNLIQGGPCTTALGVDHVLTRRSDGSVPSPTFNSNTIGGSPPFASSGAPTSVSVGVSLSAPPGGVASMQGGTWRNNILFAGPVGATPSSRQAAFEERGTTADPTALTNNLFQVFGGPMTPPLYVDEGATVRSTTTAINTMMDTTAAGSVAGDPLFMNPAIGNFALTAASPASRAGTPTGAPAGDLVGTPRPTPVGTNPDIGCLEAGF
ncbi:MAG: hypothetical protein IAE78_14510 [Myxococcus sp.]|nr:hypothetical protein [Myxococcus sp.]